MKNGTRPTRRQKKLLGETGLNWEEWLVLFDLPDCLVVRRRDRMETRVIRKENGRV